MKRNIADQLIKQLFEEVRALREDLRLSLPAAMLTIAQVADRMNVSRAHVKRLIRAGDLAVVRRGEHGHPRIPVTALQDYQSEAAERASPKADASRATVAKAARTPRAPRSTAYDAKAEAAKLRAKMAERAKRKR